jgi:CBS domain-containing protein
MISGAPVVDAMDQVISIMGEGDALRLAATYGLEATVSHCLPHLIATNKVITLTETSTFADAYRAFLKNKIHRIPIVDGNGNLKGLVTRSTLLLLFVEAHYGKKIPRAVK